MAKLFIKQAEQYAAGRPTYPAKLFEYIASKTPAHDLVWDVGTGTGQAAHSLAAHYTTVIATDTSPKQLDFTTKHPNIHYRHTPPTMSITEVEQTVAPQGSVDLVTIAQALHWFDLPSFYKNVRWVLKKPHGIIAAWCYTLPEVNSAIDAVLRRIYTTNFGPYWEAPRRFIDEEYKTIEFPFESIDEEGTITSFAAEKEMKFEDYLTYLRSWSSYQTAKGLGVELLSNEVIEELEKGWKEDGDMENDIKVAKFPIHLKIGRVGNNN
ncbi:putative methyltransferase DDB_G0268948 [Cucurbita pepo subsp. pepo]|uniref:putative methyltransferase DDB_G0268948 n=1 Tax=Cucurbita pepo subsp. pepo TaxID=3664 RepID=UPI000C9D6F4A|nr:putative methyltransferase DDB_G0268948 [Cucurbita pepo subsp. pepo]